MHRSVLLNSLYDYLSRNPQEALICQEFIHFVKTEAHCFERDLTKGHITASALLLNPSKDKILLTHHKKLNMWLQPGGHADGDSEFLQVALKEAEEESGLIGLEILNEQIFDIDIHEIPAHKDDPPHKHYDIRIIVHSSKSEDYIVSDESHDLAWAELKTLEKWTREESILRMRDKLLK